MTALANSVCLTFSYIVFKLQLAASLKVQQLGNEKALGETLRRGSQIKGKGVDSCLEWVFQRGL